jgi:hypothetical protein
LPVSAILVVGAQSILSASGDQSVPRANNEALASSIASLEVMGQSIVERTLVLLHLAGLHAVSVVSEASILSKDGQNFVPQVLVKEAQKGFATVVFVRLGAYAEVDYTELINFHADKGAAVTRVCDDYGPLDIWVLDTDHEEQSASYLEAPSCAVTANYLTKGYVNRLSDARDVRRLAVDAFMGRCSIRPAGRQVRPGVWIDDGARVHKSARIVAPAYIGRGARVRASALVTRCSNVERRCMVDYGTAIEDTSMLPHTYVGRGLDVAHAVLDGNRLANLSRNVTMTIDDATILGRTLSPRRWFATTKKKVEIVEHAAETFTVEPPAPTPARQRPALRVLSKGEI